MKPIFICLQHEHKYDLSHINFFLWGGGARIFRFYLDKKECEVDYLLQIRNFAIFFIDTQKSPLPTLWTCSFGCGFLLYCTISRRQKTITNSNKWTIYWKRFCSVLPHGFDVSISSGLQGYLFVCIAFRFPYDVICCVLASNKVNLDQYFLYTLDAYMNKKLLLETPSEQSRLLNEVPEVIAAIEKCDPVLEYSRSQDKQGNDGSSESAPRESPQTPGTALANGTSWRANGRTDPAGSLLDQERDLEGAAAKRKRKQASANFEQSSSIDGSNGDHERDLEDAKDRSRRKKVPTIHDCKQSPCIPSGQAAELEEPKVARLERMNCESTSEVKVIELSDNDEDVIVSVKTPALEVPGSDLWYCMSPLGEMRGPYKLSLLKLWSVSSGNELRYKVWRVGQSKEEAIFLNDAIHGNFPTCRNASKL
ncbi:putative GYF domain-containing protein [Rosa chinensis]|uniref:Putative GYF domain-containing protein n=1 Tax=Rosa chinensis TaxID=74649 RepID=A0A2P6PR59_ROSCH|nr:putative GYF domain-containing protein [Rosa chinensis]